MSGETARFVGSIPQHYDQGLGPMIFVDYADLMARRVAGLQPARSNMPLGARGFKLHRDFRPSRLTAYECDALPTELLRPPAP